MKIINFGSVHKLLQTHLKNTKGGISVDGTIKLSYKTYQKYLQENTKMQKLPPKVHR